MAFTGQDKANASAANMYIPHPSQHLVELTGSTNPFIAPPTPSKGRSTSANRHDSLPAPARTSSADGVPGLSDAFGSMSVGGGGGAIKGLGTVDGDTSFRKETESRRNVSVSKPLAIIRILDSASRLIYSSTALSPLVPHHSTTTLALAPPYPPSLSTALSAATHPLSTIQPPPSCLLYRKVWAYHHPTGVFCHSKPHRQKRPTQYRTSTHSETIS